MKINSVITFGCALLFFFLSFSVIVSAVPHSLYGYAIYEDGDFPVNATVDAKNLNSSDHIFSTVSNSGVYLFDCGSPGPDWGEGDEIKITITQNNSNEYSFND